MLPNISILSHFLVLYATSALLTCSSIHKSKHFFVSTRICLSSGAAEVGATVVREAQDSYDIQRAAIFLSQEMYGPDMPIGQRKELARLEQTDLNNRYGPKVKAKYPSKLILALEDEEIIGCVGLDCQSFRPSLKKFSTTGKKSFAEEDEVVAAVLANLVTRRDRRKRGLGKLLLTECESTVKGWGFDYIYLLVDSENTNAKKLYKSKGYELQYEDQDATCVTAGDYSLKTTKCVNLCFRKSLVVPATKTGGLAGFFGSLFGKK